MELNELYVKPYFNQKVHIAYSTVNCLDIIGKRHQRTINNNEFSYSESGIIPYNVSGFDVGDGFEYLCR